MQSREERLAAAKAKIAGFTQGDQAAALAELGVLVEEATVAVETAVDVPAEGPVALRKFADALTAYREGERLDLFADDAELRDFVRQQSRTTVGRLMHLTDLLVHHLETKLTEGRPLSAGALKELTDALTKLVGLFKANDPLPAPTAALPLMSDEAIAAQLLALGARKAALS